MQKLYENHEFACAPYGSDICSERRCDETQMPEPEHGSNQTGHLAQPNDWPSNRLVRDIF
ncbi:MAG: hypothetical protein C0511_01955 [Hyphomicrobium sp.]|nr:hypothetical protein [Hyphomicrobium sp.]PPC83620.1 MAG: hypothetical protein CTY40_01950 [Hyphomicrobium sp.]